MFRILSYLYIFTGGTRFEITQAIDAYTKERFLEAREDFLVIHDDDLRNFALQKASEYPNFAFKACSSWINNWKLKHNVTSRKIQS